MNNPLPACYFLEQDDENDICVQFKLERLSDYYYKYRKLNNVTGRCSFKDSMTVTTMNGISARLCGPWIRVEHKGCMNFINTSELNNRKQVEVERIYKNIDLARIMEEKFRALGSQTAESCEKEKVYLI